MSARKRKDISKAREVALVTQVGRVCPLCNCDLFYKKNQRDLKKYEIAHIYPLNPTNEEIELLKNETRISDDPDDDDNLIPLCFECHKKFDNPRTVPEYRELLAIKKDLINKSLHISLMYDHSIEEDIINIVKSIYEGEDLVTFPKINYDPKVIEDKTDSSMNRPTINKIKHQVEDYFSFIRHSISSIDKTKNNFSVHISAQIKSFYLSQAKLDLPQQQIFDNVVEWININTSNNSRDAAEIIVSFFIQNCEVLE